MPFQVRWRRFETGYRRYHRAEDDHELRRYYSNDNVCLSAAHPHLSVGGFSHCLFCNVPNQGFIEDNFVSVAEGSYASIKAMSALKLEATRQHSKALDLSQGACKSWTVRAINGMSS